MSRNSANFGDKKIKKSDSYKNGKEIKTDEIDVNKILASKEESYGKKNSFKYFIAYNDNDVMSPLRIKLLKMIGYVKIFEINTTMLKNSDKQLLKKYKEIWKKVKSLFSIKIETVPVYDDNDNYIKTKIKIYNRRLNTNFSR